MLSINHATFPNAFHAGTWRGIGTFCLREKRVNAPPLVLLSFLVLFLPGLARGDDLTGTPQRDPKDSLSLSANRPPMAGAISFLPLPSWSRVAALSPLPDQLKPLGKVAVLVTPPTAAPAPLAPSKETPPASPAPAVAASKEKTSPAPAETSPALIAVSPFLQWIKANPQAAAEQARQQAGAYSAVDPSGAIVAAPTPNANAAPNNSGTVPVVVAPPAPYWMPPLIDAAPIVSNPGNISGSGAAIYSTPQR